MSDLIKVLASHAWVAIPKGFITDKRLDLAAKGALLMAITRAEGCGTLVSVLQANSSTGRDGCYAALNRLEAAGYATKSQERTYSGAMGQVQWTVAESPELLAASGKAGSGSSVSGQTGSGKAGSGAEKPEAVTGLPDTGKPEAPVNRPASGITGSGVSGRGQYREGDDLFKGSESSPHPETPDPEKPEGSLAKGWNMQLAKAWTEVTGGMINIGRLSKALRPLVVQHGMIKVEAGLRLYLTSQKNANKLEMAAPEVFARSFGQWIHTPATEQTWTKKMRVG